MTCYEFLQTVYVDGVEHKHGAIVSEDAIHAGCLESLLHTRKARVATPEQVTAFVKQQEAEAAAEAEAKAKAEAEAKAKAEAEAKAKAEAEKQSTKNSKSKE